MIAGLGFKASAGAVPHVDADVYRAPDVRDRVHVGGDEGRGARGDASAPRRRLPREGGALDGAIAVIAVVSLAVGNLAALVQRDVKRLLAYSSVSHAGFMLIAIAANSELGAGRSSTT